MCLLHHEIFHGHRIFQYFYHITSFKPINIVFEVCKYHSWPNTLTLWGANTCTPLRIQILVPPLLRLCWLRVHVWYILLTCSISPIAYILSTEDCSESELCPPIISPVSGWSVTPKSTNPKSEVCASLPTSKYGITLGANMLTHWTKRSLSNLETSLQSINFSLIRFSQPEIY